MSSLKQKKANRLLETRDRQVARLTISIDWQIAPVSPFTSRQLLMKQTLRAVNFAWLEQGKASVNVRMVSAEESQAINAEWRDKSYPTNVLSFPFEYPEGIASSINLLGDLVICPEILLKECQEQGKSFIEHWTHLLVHGMLHLQGYDHEDEREAEAMEALEIAILAHAGFRNPYQ